MRRSKLFKIFGFILLLLPVLSNAQSTVVSATLVDSTTTVWADAHITVTFVQTPGAQGPYTWSGGAYNAGPISLVANGSGVFSITLPSNNFIAPANSQWQFIITPNASTQATILNVSVAGATLNLSSLFTSSAVPFVIQSMPVPRAYNKPEVAVPPNVGQIFYNTIDKDFNFWNGTIWDTIIGGTPGTCISDCVITDPTTSQTIIQPTTTSLNSNIINHVFYADDFTGGDIAAKINAAFAEGSGTAMAPNYGTVVYLTPQSTYSFSGTINIPNDVSSPYIRNPILDCQGAHLIYTGSGVGIKVRGENDTSSGEFRNCFVTFNNTAAQFIIESRIHYRVTGNTFILGTSGITVLNTISDGGPGYTEQQNWNANELTVNANSCGITFTQAADVPGGSGSFFYNYFNSFHLSLFGDNAWGFCLTPGPGGTPSVASFGSYFNIRVNSGAGANNQVFHLGSAASIIRGTVLLSGESAGGTPVYDVYASTRNSEFYNFGQNDAIGFFHGYGANVPEGNINYISGLQPMINDIGTGNGILIQSGESGGINPALQCKNIQLSGNTVFLMANVGTDPACYWQLGSRITSNASGNDDVDITGSGGPIKSIIFSDPITSNVGIGPGYSIATQISGGVDISKPTLGNLEVRSNLAVRDPTAANTIRANGGAVINRYADHTTGNLIDHVVTSPAGGQNTNHYQMLFYDTMLFTDVVGLDCYSSTFVHCAIPFFTINKQLQSGSASNTDLVGELTFIAATTGLYTFTTTFLTHPECVVQPQSTTATSGSPWVTYTGVASFTVNFTAAFSGQVSYHCIGRN